MWLVRQVPERDGWELADQIQLRDMRFLGMHGALPEEQDRAQPFAVDLDVFMDLRGAGRDDNLATTVDYASLCQAVRTVVEGPHASLLEHLAEDVASRVLEVCDGRAWRVVVTVRKLRPPVPVQMSYAAVRVCRP